MQVISHMQNGTRGTSLLDQSYVPDGLRIGHDEGNLRATCGSRPPVVRSLVTKGRGWIESVESNIKDKLEPTAPLIR